VGIDQTDWRDADRLNEQGRVRADAADWDAALSLYRQAVDRVPAYEPAWFNMALVHKQRGSGFRRWTATSVRPPSAARRVIPPGGTWV
jgi:tetratricopeptide (TPR) repeat protein